MSDRIRIRVLRVPLGDRIADAALAAMVGTGVQPSGTVVAAAVVDGWVVLDVVGIEVGASVVSDMSTGLQHIEPPAPPADLTSWIPQ